MEHTVINTKNTGQKQEYRLQFLGKGSEYFTIMIVNWLLTLVTLGIYYPWARAKRLKYTFGQTALNDERFNFSGTGKEMFRGFVKVILFYIVLIGIYAALLFNIGIFPAILFLIIGFMLFYPLIIHGSFRYRMSRTSYRGIRFGYRGDRNWLLKNSIKWSLLTIVTIGIYGAWEEMKIRRYTHENIRYGNVAFANNCDGTDWFLINLKGILLSIITLGIYSFWWERNMLNYYIDNMSMTKDEQTITCHSTITAGGLFKLQIVNLFLIVFTLGFGTAWAEMRTLNYIWSNIKMEGNIDLAKIRQTEEEYTNAFGEGAMDFFDIDLA